MKTTNLKIGQRVAKKCNNFTYKVGKVKEINGDKVLVDYDKHDNRWINIENLEILS